MGGNPYKKLEKTVTIVVFPNNRKAPLRGQTKRSKRAAGQGLEPQLPEPESGVLPLDDPAGLARDGSNLTPRRSELELEIEPVDRDESFLVLGVDMRDHLDVRLET